MNKKRMSNRERRIKRFVRYMERTYKNKLYALGFIGIGILATMIEGDATALAFLLVFAIPAFFADKNLFG